MMTQQASIRSSSPAPKNEVGVGTVHAAQLNLFGKSVIMIGHNDFLYIAIGELHTRQYIKFKFVCSIAASEIDTKVTISGLKDLYIIIIILY